MLDGADITGSFLSKQEADQMVVDDNNIMFMLNTDTGRLCKASTNGKLVSYIITEKQGQMAIISKLEILIIFGNHSLYNFHVI